MKTNQQKFERTRAKFQRNIELEKQKAKQTIFLNDDELPRTSKGRGRGYQPQHNARIKNQRQAQSSPSPQPSRTNRARNFRMTVVTSPGQNLNQAGDTHTEAAKFWENREPAYEEIIDISEDDDVAPPPPPMRMNDPINEKSEEDPWNQTSPSPIWDDPTFEMDDFDIDDPFILEFCRTFGGMHDTTVDMRTQTPPSPASSTSSIDWESENFRPPTPPKRRGFVTLEVRDRQYPYWGMQCYEQQWKARVIVPKTNSMPAIVNHTGSPTSVQMIYAPGSPCHQYETQYPRAPPTPGRGWLDTQREDLGEWYPAQNNPTPSSTIPPATSPIPPPPPMVPLSASPPPPPPPLSERILPDNPQLDGLPVEVQQAITQRIKSFQTARVRFRQTIYGQPYRVTTRRNGTIQITRI